MSNRFSLSNDTVVYPFSEFSFFADCINFYRLKQVLFNLDIKISVIVGVDTHAACSL